MWQRLMTVLLALLVGICVAPSTAPALSRFPL